MEMLHFFRKLDVEIERGRRRGQIISILLFGATLALIAAHGIYNIVVGLFS